MRVSIVGQVIECVLTLFSKKDAVLPAWEDPANKHGGKWSVQFPREKTRDRIDQMWLYMVSG